MTIPPVSLVGDHVRLDPLRRDHCDALLTAARDGDLWSSQVTVVPGDCFAMEAYVDAALAGQARGDFLPFVITRLADRRVVGTTRYRAIEPIHRRLEIGFTWVAGSAQRSAVNTEAKYLLLRHAFETLKYVRVEFITDVLNQQSRDAIERLGAREEGVRRWHMIMPDGRHRDSVCYSIIEPEWATVKDVLESKLRGAAPASS